MASPVYDIAIRLDGLDHSDLLEVLEQDGGAFLVVREVSGDNVHFHVVLHSKRKHTAVRAALKRQMPGINGNGAYSCVPVRDLGKYQRYIMKGDSRDLMPEVVAANGVNYCDPSWQEEMHDLYWDENEELTRKRKRQPTFEVVLDACKERGIVWSNREAIARIYIKELSDRDKPINLFSLKNQINLIQIKLCPDDSAIEDLAAKCV